MSSVSVPGTACIQKQPIQHLPNLRNVSVPVKMSEILQVVTICPQQGVYDAPEVWSTSYIKDGSVSSSTNKRLHIFLEIGVLFFDGLEISKLDNHRTPPSIVIEWLCPQHSCWTLAHCQGAYQNPFCLVEQATQQIIKLSRNQL